MKNLVDKTLLMSLLDELSAVITFIDTDYRIFWTNKANRDAHGLSLKEMEGIKCYTLKEYSKPCRNCPVSKVFESGQPCEAEVLQNEDKSPLDAQNSWIIKASPIRDSDGNIIGAIKIAHDITENKRTEKQLQLKEAFINDIMATSKDWIWAMDLQGIHTYSNEALEKTLGYRQDEFIGKPFSTFMHPEDLPKVEKALPDIIRKKKGWFNLTVRWKHKDGSWREMESNAVPILDSLGDVTGFRGIDRDFTERNQLMAHLIQAQKMEAVGRLAGGIAHDFNNMLGVILGYSEMALDQMNPSQKLSGALTEIQNAAGHSANLTRQLLAFARKQVIKPKVLQLNDTMAGALNLLRRLIGEDINLEWLPGKKLWPVKIDPSQIDQILANLCVNARDAINGVGKVTIETDNYVVDKAYCVDRPGLIPGEYATLSVTDTGSGIDKEIMNNMFEPFFTTKPRGEGTGLGLATVYGIAKQNNGFIYASSEPGEYTTFKVYLPRYSGKMEPGKKIKKIIKAQTGTETILLVEDEVIFLELAGQMLEELGYNVVSFNSPLKALEAFRKFKQDIQLLITDVVMPDISGNDLYHDLIAIRPDLKCLFISGYPESEISDEIDLNEDIHFLHKPFTMEELATKVREILDSDQ